VLTKRFTGKGRAEHAAGLASEEVRQLNAALADRDAAIAGLEQTVAAQQAQIATLEAALERAKFQARIREQGHSTQLSAASERAVAAERLLADQQARLGELEASRDALARKLADVPRVREAPALDAVSIDEMLESFARPQEPSPRSEPDYEDDSPTGSFTIEEMLPPDVMFAGKTAKGGNER